MALFDSTLRSFESGQLQQILASRKDLSAQDYLVIADELLKREQEIEGLNTRFESLVRSLNEQRLRYIDSNDFEFSKATVIATVTELRIRKIKTKQWFIHDGHNQSGPWDYIDLLQNLEDKDRVKTKIWAEGMAQWVEWTKLPHLLKPYFFRQKVEAVQKKVPNQPNQVKSSVPLWSGILQLIAFPFWAMLSIFSPINGAWSYTGIALPAFISMSMCLVSIPLGIGLLQSRRWAFQIKIASGIIVIAWFLSKVLIDDSSQLWLFMAIWEVIILTFVFNRSSSFN
jgi:hypothetical protein